MSRDVSPNERVTRLHLDPALDSGMAPAIENPYEERQAFLLERIIKNVDLLNESLQEMNRSVAAINNHNQEITIVAEMWNGYHRNVEFNLQNMDAHLQPSASQAGPAKD
ncbi:Similar to S.cerevisiae protein DAD4 (Essential subunit of the Dam1 complex (aka DASH complex)) [Malassezia sympodialis ATCC 42132]|uniref:DASH complex subunit DAD4 n=1 Tax=Malassezia sympodialis (strain ATCC 42132) TaxID=1230383 RepID=A0A1M8AB91_MALS4|nr:Similar to S.cerevisiae protein DAD4 (Essential subunit of the Dam1 complex (aka DASH complex)) [Malassezia sympodialis ATCC 42132]